MHIMAHHNELDHFGIGVQLPHQSQHTRQRPGGRLASRGDFLATSCWFCTLCTPRNMSRLLPTVHSRIAHAQRSNKWNDPHSSQTIGEYHPAYGVSLAPGSALGFTVHNSEFKSLKSNMELRGSHSQVSVTFLCKRRARRGALI